MRVLDCSGYLVYVPYCVDQVYKAACLLVDLRMHSLFCRSVDDTACLHEVLLTV
jgi:hypothetical protein